MMLITSHNELRKELRRLAQIQILKKRLTPEILSAETGMSRRFIENVLNGNPRYSNAAYRRLENVLGRVIWTKYKIYQRPYNQKPSRRKIKCQPLP